MLHTVLTETRATWRLLRLLALLVQGLLTVRLRFPGWSEAQQRHIKQRWSAKLLDSLGVRLKSCTTPIPPRTLIVCNHISWLDVFVINALTQTHFVCKDEVRHWPVFGWLVENTGTVFIERGNRAAAARTAQALATTISRGERVVVFPEGTTTNGHSLLPFRTALFQAAVECEAQVTPVVLRYVDAHGNISSAAAYDGDISFWGCLRAITRARHLQAEVRVLEALAPTMGRRELAETSWNKVADGLGMRHSLPDQSQPVGGEATGQST